jgi:hypothetical protein
MIRPFKNTFLVRFLRALIEIGFIIFLFYSNLLMGEYTRSKMLLPMSLSSAIEDIFTPVNFIIALNTGIFGFFVVEFLRRKFK